MSDKSGFVFFGGSEEDMKAEMTRRQMGLAEYRSSVERLVDELAPEHCHTLFRLLANLRGNKASTDYMLGQLAYMLRKVHKICASCGGNHVDADHELANLIEVPKVEKKIFADDLRSLEDILAAFGISLTDENNADGPVFCKICKTQYTSIQARVDSGEVCLICSHRNG